MVKKYKKRPIIIEALQWTGKNVEEMKMFVGKENCQIEDFSFFIGKEKGYFLKIRTLEGEMMVNEGDYVLKGVRGEFYPCNESIFLETYYEV